MVEEQKLDRTAEVGFLTENSRSMRRTIRATPLDNLILLFYGDLYGDVHGDRSPIGPEMCGSLVGFDILDLARLYLATLEFAGTTVEPGADTHARKLLEAMKWCDQNTLLSRLSNPNRNIARATEDSLNPQVTLLGKMVLQITSPARLN